MICLAQKVVRRLSAEVHEFRRWENFDAKDIRLYYGMDNLPSREGSISGGIVKCLDLAERFPNVANNANLLYLVSSALPERRELLLRAAHRAGAKVVLNQNGVAYPAWAGESWKIQNAPNAFLHERADFVVYQSEFCRRCAVLFLGERNGSSEVLYNPVDTSVFSPKNGFDCANESPVFLVAGSHHDKDRVKMAISAVSSIRQKGVDARLIVAGRLVWGPHAEEEARQWTKTGEIENSVVFRGAYSQAEAPTLFQSADVLIHLKVQDPCPRLVVEAMACGVPVVYSATGGTPELAGEEAGVGIEGHENFEIMQKPPQEAVNEAILRALANRVVLARQARSRAVRLFSHQDWQDAHSRIFAGLAGAGSP